MLPEEMWNHHMIVKHIHLWIRWPEEIAQDARTDITVDGEKRWKVQADIIYLFLNNLNHVFIPKHMRKAAMLGVVPCTSTPHQHILHILNKTSMYVITEIFYRTATSILKSLTTKKKHQQNLNRRPSPPINNQRLKFLEQPRMAREKIFQHDVQSNIQQKGPQDLWSLVAGLEALYKLWQDPSRPTFLQAICPDSAVS